jgi:hypothetical protein
MASPLDFTRFDHVTKSGKVFSTESVHTSSVELTKNEKLERKQWAKDKVTIMDAYCEFLGYEPIRAKGRLLQMRIAAPVLSVEGASARSSTKDRRKQRVYPDALYEWENFMKASLYFHPQRWRPIRHGQ